MKRMNLRTKLILGSLAIGLIPILFVSIFSMNKFLASLESIRFDQLNSIRVIKKKALENYFKQIRDQGVSTSNNLSTIEATKNFARTFDNIKKDNELDLNDSGIIGRRLTSFYTNEFGKKYKKNTGKESESLSRLDQLDEAAEVAQYYYIYKNRNPLGSKHLMTKSSDKSEYSKFHNKYHPNFKEVLERFGYYDIFLVDDNGRVIYSVYKELDFGVSLVSGPYVDSGLAKAYISLVNAKNTEEYNLQDFSNYYPSNEAPASFFATPIFDKRNRIGTLIFQMPLNKINEIMVSSEGMGKTGETYLVGSDNLMRSDSRLDPKNRSVVASFTDKENGQIKTESTRLAMNGESGKKIITGYQDTKVLSSFSPVKILGLTWGFLAEIDLNEAFTEARDLKNMLLLFGLVAALLILALVVYVSKIIADPILYVANNLDLNSNSARLISETIGESSQRIAELVTEEAAAIQETVAGMEEMSSMINQSNDFAKKSRDLAEDVLGKTIQGDRIMKDLSHSMESIQESNNQLQGIGDIISDINNKTNVINDIVFKTQLLSFNASIEAARAGQHGKGFAVVAEEVGNLAMMSGKAAGEIRGLLEDSRKQVDSIIDKTKTTVTKGESVTHEALSTFNEISGSISKVTEQLNSIVQATVEQKDGVGQATLAMKQLDVAAKTNSDIARSSSEQVVKLNEITMNLEVLNKQLNNTVLGSSKRKSNIKGISLGGIKKPVKDTRDLSQITQGILSKSLVKKEVDLDSSDFI